ncbi:DUF2752 domain-containing protein [Flavisericum labens]|uniref:DUF2752 domain-containing protein n=1 Tax=Flavisericum labens TaxID=3377112 RepID=UPI00387B25C9
MEKYMLPCLNKKLFGIECLGCGLQRAVALVFQGEFMAAFKMYPAVYSLIIFVFCIGVNIFFKFNHSNKVIGGLAIISVTTIVVSYIVKLII